MRHAIVWAAALLMGITSVRGDAPHRFSITKLTTTPAAQQSRRITVPAGTRILVRTSDSLDSRNQKAGARFTGVLETNLKAEDKVVAPRGSTVYGRLAGAKSAGRFAGSSQLTLELTDIVINGTAYPIVTTAFQLRGRGEGRTTTRRVAGGTGLGALIGGIAGGGRGAGIGALVGAGAGTAASARRGQQIEIPSESLLEFRLAQPVALPVSR